MSKPKLKIIVPVLAVIILAAGGFFWWQRDKIESFLERIERENMVAPSKDYSIVEKSDGKFIINKKDGFEAEIPTDWEIELNEKGEISESDREIILYSKNFSYRPPNGCLIRIQINRVQRMPIKEFDGAVVMYPFEGSEDIKETIDSYKEVSVEEMESIKEKGIDIISVNQYESLREITIIGGDVGERITVNVPTENRLYIFENTRFSEECKEVFDNFLETASIQ